MSLGPELYILLALVAFGAMVQTVTGFAMGLMIIVGVAALDLVSISFAAAVISFISLLNTLIALKDTHRFIDRQFVMAISLGLTPFLVLGVFVLDFLSSDFYHWLRTILGVVIIAAGILLMVTPKPYATLSPRWVSLGVGSIAGVIAGLYSAGGAPLAYFMYRQPLELQVIRATLLAVFALSTLWRTMVVAGAGHVTLDVVKVAALSVPVVVLTTIATGRALPKIPDKLVRRLVFILMIGVGLFLIVT